MGKYKLRLNLNTGGTVVTNAIDLPAKVVSAEFVEEVSNITFTIANTPGGTLTFEAPGNLTWDDLANNGAKDSTNTYTISIYNGNVTLNSNVQYVINNTSNTVNPVSTTSIPTDGATYYYVNPAALN